MDSSPRVRGKRRHAEAVGAPCRFIPAHAGKTMGEQIRRLGLGVHPRACGENAARMAPDSGPEGSSPRMRGKPEHVCGGAPRGGFIPAHAGKTCPGSTPLSLRRVHPRACGENHGDWDVRPRGFGSSPRMRGKRDCGGCRPPGCGFIPAHAGKTQSSPPMTRRSRGSSPRMRGKHHLMGPRAEARGFIPAHAGKTRRNQRGPVVRRFIPAHAGKRLEAPDGVVAARFIPAHAGKTATTGTTVARSRVHPRACGENHG